MHEKDCGKEKRKAVSDKRSPLFFRRGEDIQTLSLAVSAVDRLEKLFHRFGWSGDLDGVDVFAPPIDLLLDKLFDIAAGCGFV